MACGYIYACRRRREGFALKIYVNHTAHRATRDREKAMGWYHSGDTVSVYKDGRKILCLVGTKQMGLA